MLKLLLNTANILILVCFYKILSLCRKINELSFCFGSTFQSTVTNALGRLKKAILLTYIILQHTQNLVGNIEDVYILAH